MHVCSHQATASVALLNPTTILRLPKQMIAIVIACSGHKNNTKTSPSMALMVANEEPY
jgi:hypothetical protein